MAPTLHHSYTADEAVAAFGESKAEALCDGQFLVLPKAVLCLATVGDPATQSHLGAPSSVLWRPGRMDYDPADEYPWLPTPAREVWANRKKLRNHHVFLRLPGD